MKYKCLILDHDETMVNSTATIHYPAHVEAMKRIRPGETPIDLNGWFQKNFHPGIMAFLTDELAFTEEEMGDAYRIWHEFNADRNPSFFPGLPELMKRYQDAGGILSVVSHSTEENIRRHYQFGAPELTVDLVYGWDHDEDKRKPSPWPVLQILEKTGLKASDVLVIDDLKPAVDMARAAGADVAAAGWGHNIPEIRRSMKEICDYWLPNPAALEEIILG